MIISEWHDFFVTTAGSAAALTGLLFVGVSINITKILSFPKLPDRALLSLLLLLTILVISLVNLIPGQSVKALSREMSCIGIFMYIVVTAMDVGIYKHTLAVYKKPYFISFIFNQLSVLPYLFAGMTMVLFGDQGIYWIAPGIILSFIKAVIDAWVLLVEINR